MYMCVCVCVCVWRGVGRRRQFVAVEFHNLNYPHYYSKSSSLMGGPCGTHDKDEKSESANLANGPRLGLTVTIEEYDPSKRSELFAERRTTHPTRPESSMINSIKCLKCHTDALVTNST